MTERGADEARGLWAASAQEVFSAPGPVRDQSCDLVVIGGGFTGCAAALQAAQAGARVVLLEAQSIGHGGSGRNVGLVNAGLWVPPETLEATLGQVAAQRLSRALADAPGQVFELIARHEIACEPVRAGTLHCAHSPKGLRGLQERFRQLRAQDAPVALISGEEARARVGTETIYGALHDPRAGTIQPLAYVRGLARAAVKSGAQVHEHACVSRIERQDEEWCVIANGQQIRAPRLLVATNAYHLGIGGIEIPETAQVSYFQCATAPLSDNLAGSVLPGGEGCWDTATVMTSWRKDAAGRVILGAMGKPEGLGRAAHLGWARRRLARMFPQLADVPFEHLWHGQIAMTRDHVPKILNIGPQASAVFGYSGRGIAPGTLFGRCVARHLLGADADVLPIKPVAQYSETGTAARTWLYEAGARLVHAGAR